MWAAVILMAYASALKFDEKRPVGKQIFLICFVCTECRFLPLHCRLRCSPWSSYMCIHVISFIWDSGFGGVQWCRTCSQRHFGSFCVQFQGCCTDNSGMFLHSMQGLQAAIYRGTSFGSCKMYACCFSSVLFRTMKYNLFSHPFRLYNPSLILCIIITMNTTFIVITSIIKTLASVL